MRPTPAQSSHYHWLDWRVMGMGGQSPEVAVQGGMSWWVVGSGGGGRGLRCRCTTPSPHQVQAGCASPLPLLGTQQGCGGGGGRGRAWVLRRQVGWAGQGGWWAAAAAGGGCGSEGPLSAAPLWCTASLFCDHHTPAMLLSVQPGTALCMLGCLRRRCRALLSCAAWAAGMLSRLHIQPSHSAPLPHAAS